MKTTAAIFSFLFIVAASARAQTLAPSAWTEAPAVTAAPVPGLQSEALRSLLQEAPRALEAPLPPLALSALPAAPEGAVLSDADIEAFAEAARLHFGSPKTVERAGRVRKLGVPSDEEISGNVSKSPADNAAREKLVRELFLQAGAKAEDVKALDIGRGRHNFMVVKPGRTDKVLIVGGHHDKVSVGQGVIDNWTGATMVIHLYQLLKDLPTEHTLVFMTFGREEEGLVGSRKYVESLSGEERAKIAAMVNLDTLAVDGTYSWKNNSDQALLDAVARTAKDGGYALEPRHLDGGDADSSSFRDAGIPAITIFGASPETIFDIIHSDQDNFRQFNLAHYKNALLLTGALLRRLDAGR